MNKGLLKYSIRVLIHYIHTCIHFGCIEVELGIVSVHEGVLLLLFDSKAWFKSKLVMCDPSAVRSHNPQLPWRNRSVFVRRGWDGGGVYRGPGDWVTVLGYQRNIGSTEL